MTMLNKLLNIAFPNSESSFIYYALPAILSLSSIVLIWILILFLNGFIKIKSEKWKQAAYHKSYTRNFIVTEKSFIQKTLTATRRILCLYILFMLVSNILETFSIALTDSFNHPILHSEKIWNTIAGYSHKTGLFLVSIAHLTMNIFLTVLVAIWCIRILQKALNIVMHKTEKDTKTYESMRLAAKKNTLSSVTGHLLKIIISIMAAFTILESLGINIAALLATAGVASVAVGFGAQSLVKDFIAGFFILFEDQFTVGDAVELMTSAGIVSGSIERMTLRMAKIRSNEGSLLTIPNGDIRFVKNFTTDWAQVDFKFGLAIKDNIEKVSLIFQEEVELLCKNFAQDIIGIPDVRLMEKIVDFENKSSSVSFRAFIKTNSIKNKIKLESELNKRLIDRVKKEGVYT